jgi:hypothetical protein
MVNPTGKQLLKASRDLFRQDRQMIALPVIGGIASLIGALIIGGAIGGVAAASGVRLLYAVAAFGALWIAGAVSIFFQVAVVFACTDRLEGRAPSVKGSLAQAWARRGIVAKWALLAAAVGLVIQAIEQRAGVFGRLIGFLGGLAWAVATFFVVPIVAFEDVSPLAAVKGSSSLLTKRFGTVARTSLRFGIVYLGWLLGALAVLVLGVVLIGPAPVLGFPVAAIGLGGLLVVSVLMATVGIYLRTILYRYATSQAIPGIELDLSTVFSNPRPLKP